jgi:hypothetical protein
MSAKTWIADTESNYSTAGSWSPSAPTTGDDVVFNGTHVGNCVMDADTAELLSWNMTGYTGTLKSTHAITITVASGTSTCLFAGTSPTWSGVLTTKVSAGATCNLTMGSLGTAGTCGGVTIQNTGSGSTVFLDGFTIGSTKAVTLASGTLHTDGATDNAGLVHSWGAFNSSNSNVRTLTLGASNITITGGAVSDGWYMVNYNNMVLNPNTAFLTLSGSGVAGYFGQFTWGGTIAFTGSGNASIGNPCTVYNLTRTGTSGKTDSFSVLVANLTVTGTLTLNGNSALNRCLIQGSTLGTANTITTTGATISCNNVDFRDITLNPGTGAQTITSFTDQGGGTVRVTTSGNHGLPSGTSYVYIAATGYNANYAATYVAAKTFDITSAYTSGTGTWTYDLTSDATHAGTKLIGDCGGNTGMHVTPATTQTCTGSSANASAATWTAHYPLPQDTEVISLTAGQTLTQDMPRMGANISFGTACNLTLGNAVTSYGSVNLTGMGAFAGIYSWTCESQPRTGVCTITCAGKSFPNDLYPRAINATVQQGDAASVTGEVDVYNGTFSDGGFSLTADKFVVAGGVVNKSGNWTLMRATAGQTYSYSSGTWSDTAGTITISNTGANAKTFAGAGQTFNSVSFPSGSGGVTITGNNTFRNATVASGGTVTVTAGSVQNFQGTSATVRGYVTSSTLGTPGTIAATGATITASNCDFRDITFTSGADIDLSAGQTTLVGDCGGNTVTGHTLTFTTASTQACTGSSNVAWTAATWTNHMPLPQDESVISLDAGKTLTVDTPRIGGGKSPGLRFTTATNLTLGNDVTSYGSWNLTGMQTFNGASQIVYLENQARTGTITVTCGGKSFPYSIAAQAINANVQLADALSCVGLVYVNNGTFTDAGFSISALAFYFNQTTIRSIVKMGSWTFNRSSGSTFNGASGGLTWSDTAGTITISDTGASAKTFAGAGQSFNNVSFPSGSGGVIITGSNSFNTVSCAAGAKVQVTNGTIQTIRNHSRWDGTSGSHITILSTTPGQFYTLSQTAGQTIGNWVDVTDSHTNKANAFYCGHNGTLDATSLANGWAKEAGKIIIST